MLCIDHMVDQLRNRAAIRSVGQELVNTVDTAEERAHIMKRVLELEQELEVGTVEGGTVKTGEDKNE